MAYGFMPIEQQNGQEVSEINKIVLKNSFKSS